MKKSNQLVNGDVTGAQQNNCHDALVKGEDFQHLSTLPLPFLEWIDKESNHIFTVNSINGDFRYISNNVQQILGHNKEDVTRTNVLSWVHPDDYYYLRSKLPEETENHVHLTYRMKSKDGHYKWIESVISRIKYKHREYFVAYSMDISRMKETTKHLAQSEKMNVAGQLAAGIAHEIRNPLTSLKGFLQLMEAGVDVDGQYFKIMKEEIEKMESITSELLYISKPQPHHRKTVSLAELLADVCTLMRSQANMHEIDIRLITDTDHSDIECDPSQIKQVFINLIKNAIEEMLEGGVVQVKLRQTEAETIVEVQDEGPGIPETIKEKIHEPFFTTKENGTGLGLMITDQIIKEHYGHLTIKDAPVKGTIIRVTLPNHSG
ncbi:PAS domain S-box protein [Virgibacillus sp. MSP4-1]|uniref:ATP-binding protein n=1 Tax=Virgibacillus sp. MSP4-1 TaxID=2700081 RepID=UPI0003A8BF28|nr:ATP-binding protein [Virgibacillus sp. MSP4-1]QHS22350.1 PAS domain S-box protein [Virgibacillus sp. MSP4-1]